MDDRIELSARKSYVFETYLKTDDITIKSVNGVVSLTGTVSEESHKSLARETVASLPKVKSVDNRLEVKGDHPAEYSDAWLKMKVKTTLLFHRSVNGWPCRTEAGAENAARLEDQFHDLRSFPLLI
jgi:osmotically-inducible protein OsmY